MELAGLNRAPDVSVAGICDDCLQNFADVNAIRNLRRVLRPGQSLHRDRVVAVRRGRRGDKPHAHGISVSGYRASGIQTGTADVDEKGTLLRASFRTPMRMSKRGGRWLLASRGLCFISCLPTEQLSTAFRDSRRSWTDEPPAQADLLETLPTWNKYRKS